MTRLLTKLIPCTTYLYSSHDMSVSYCPYFLVCTLLLFNITINMLIQQLLKKLINRNIQWLNKPNAAQ
ncbi:hypothetical protein L873DRAFT_1210473 [Choiromyces venosus 120613-1]|uniref:Uncharacterized protein n=1 Tax=Choiromyces venosus 120613-1 TaxID=1336337 RepID=A0A3N4JI75_9PEZI|nr:hypothetical protein L873DRAFT_1210473 [Choiromyces venosus 120613-1]